MRGQADHAVEELGNLRLKLRDHLVFSPEEFSGQSCYLVEDRLTSRFYRIGADEYALVSLFDGRTTVAEALAATSQALGRDAFTEVEAAAICQWFVEMELAHTDASRAAGRLAAAAGAASNRRASSNWNPVLFKIPLFNPDRLLAAVLPWCRWLLGWPAFAVWLVIVTAGLYQLIADYDRFSSSSTGVFAPGKWAMLAISWVLLKILHELFHGLVCKKFGGSVTESGVVLILFAPIAYVDATGAWRLGSKWRRIYVSAAGMYVELFCAAAAALIWSHCPLGIIGDVAFHVVVMAGLNTIVFNGNPLMRFDAYYMLADFCEVPNLAARGQEYLSSLGRRYLLGVSAQPPELPAGRKMLVKVYGVAALCWRTLVTASLLIAAHAIIPGIGLVLAVIAAAMWYGMPLVRFVKYVTRGNHAEQPELVRLLATASIAAAAVILLWTALPWPAKTRAPAVVRNSPLAVVRCEGGGFVAEVLVHDGQTVAAGQVLARIVNRELETQVDDLRLAIEETELQGDLYRHENELAAAQIQQRYVDALEKQYLEKQTQHSRLTLRAPIGGRVVGRKLPSLLGTYLQPGEELLSVAGPDTELVVSIGQDDVESFFKKVGAEVAITPLSRPSKRLKGQLVRLVPQGSLEIGSLALTAAAGGPLSVVSRVDSSVESSSAESRLQYIEPRFDGTVKIGKNTSAWLHAGQVATVWFRSHHETVGEHLHRVVGEWIRAKTKRATERSGKGASEYARSRTARRLPAMP
jgi:putative peptide zinc metalloprotease protein